MSKKTSNKTSGDVLSFDHLRFRNEHNVRSVIEARHGEEFQIRIINTNPRLFTYSVTADETERPVSVSTNVLPESTTTTWLTEVGITMRHHEAFRKYRRDIRLRSDPEQGVKVVFDLATARLAPRRAIPLGEIPPAAGAIVELECPADVRVDGAGVINARLHIDEANRRLNSAEIASRRAKESVNRAATPDDEVVVKSIRECSVRTTQVPFQAPPAN